MSKTNGKRNGRKNGKPAAKAEAGRSERLPNGQFPPGVSGNPRGLQAQFSARFRRQLHEFAAEPVSKEDVRSRCAALIEATFEQAMAGDMQATKVLFDRLIPATLQAELSIQGVGAEAAVDVFGCMMQDYATAGRLPELTARS